MTRCTNSLGTLTCVTLVVAGIALLAAGSLQAGEQGPRSSEKAASEAELSRFLEATRAQPKSVRPSSKEEPAVTCAAADRGARVVGTLNGVEQELARMRKQQLERWAAKGWTAKEAAAAGETVMLNGSGYNSR